MKYLILLMWIIPGCKRPSSLSAKETNPGAPVALTIRSCLTGSGSYAAGGVVNLSCVLYNPNAFSVSIDSLNIGIRDMSVSGALFTQTDISSGKLLASGDSLTVTAAVWTVPGGAAADAYGIYLSYSSDGKQSALAYQTFFRVTGQSTLTTYQIGKTSYQGFDVFTLDGGMSAEYAVEKSIESLDAGISHSWFVSAPGSGPDPVYATPEFLRDAVEETVKNYNDYLGPETVFNTVIISTGIPSIPYLSNVMKAPVLPLHFLASVNTEKEIQSIMDYSNQHGLPSYATLGYDLSVQPAVAWIKLLDLPEAYLQFLRQHNVCNVVIAGESIAAVGETQAKQVLNNCPGAYQPGSIYILYPGNSADDAATLSGRIADLNEVSQATGFTTIADWESGVIAAQVNNFARTIKDSMGISGYSLNSPNLLDLYDLGTYATLAYFQKNNLEVKGIALNPYLLSHPGYESRKGFIPVNYWQGNSALTTVARLLTTTKKAVADFFPAIDIKQLDFWVNSSRNFGGAEAAEELITSLQSNGLSQQQQNNYSVDEVWDLADGMDAICEKIVTELSAATSPAEYRTWIQGQAPLSMQDLTSIIQNFPTIQFEHL
jgi:hypothetical protein